MVWVALIGWAVAFVFAAGAWRGLGKRREVENQLRAARSRLGLAPAMLTIPDFDWMTETGMANYREWAGIQR